MDLGETVGKFLIFFNVPQQLEGVPRAGKDDEKGAGVAAEGMEGEVCVLGLGVLAQSRYTSLP